MTQLEAHHTHERRSFAEKAYRLETVGHLPTYEDIFQAWVRIQQEMPDITDRIFREVNTLVKTPSLLSADKLVEAFKGYRRASTHENEKYMVFEHIIASLLLPAIDELSQEGLLAVKNEDEAIKDAVQHITTLLEDAYKVPGDMQITNQMINIMNRIPEIITYAAEGMISEINTHIPNAPNDLSAEMVKDITDFVAYYFSEHGTYPSAEYVAREFNVDILIIHALLNLDDVAENPEIKESRAYEDLLRHEEVALLKSLIEKLERGSNEDKRKAKILRLYIEGYTYKEIGEMDPQANGKPTSEGRVGQIIKQAIHTIKPWATPPRIHLVVGQPPHLIPKKPGRSVFHKPVYRTKSR